MKLFAQIRKVDEEKRMVYGRAAQEVVDRVGEVFDYEKSKPYFQDWSKSFSEATDGKSQGNVRAMHGKVSAGIVKDLDFNDAAKAIDIGAHITDDQEWRKVLAGNYTGFSIGGSYVGEKVAEKMDGKDVHRYTANPAEISIVDSPCIPTARFFEVVKADGALAKVEFQPPQLEVMGTDDEVAKFAEALNVHKMTMADAIALIEKAAHDKANPPQKDEVAEVIAEAMAAGAMQKTLNDPALKVGALLKLAVAHGVELEEIDAAMIDAAVEESNPVNKIKAAILAKAGKLSTGQMDRLQAAHDHLVGVGASCGADKTVKPEDLTKAAPDKLQAEVTELRATVDKLLAQPVPHVVLRTVNKAYTRVNGTEEEQPNETVTGQIMAKGYEWTVKNPDKSIDWIASAKKLAEETGAAA